MEKEIGELFQSQTKHSPWGKGIKEIELKPLATIPLPQPDYQGGAPLWKTILKRRSIRNYSPKPLALKQLAQLLWASQGISDTVGHFHLRTAPSAGALYPLETYLIVNNVQEIKQGIYHFEVEESALTLLAQGDFKAEAAFALLEQSFAARAAVLFLWVAVINRCKRRYRERAYRYIYLDAGHAAENLHLAAVSLGLGGCPIGAFYDDEVNKLVGVDGHTQTVIYTYSVGYPAT